jgi:hypothetical protein
VPSTGWISLRREKINIIPSTIGKSARSGAIATLIPSILPCLRLSEITRVNNGPGISPLLRPKTIPEMKKLISDVIVENTELLLLFNSN